MTSNAMPPRLPGYDFKRRIGSGATSIVYLYRQRMPDRDVAVKVSRTVLDPYAAARYRIEAECLARLSSHPAILPIHAVGVTDDGHGYLVLGYAPFGSYRERCRRRPLSADQTLDLGVVLAGALYAAHRVGIVHRDVKPSNVLIDAQGAPVLADFGIAASMYRSDHATGHSEPWAAPEVLEGRSGGTDASDVYSLGATLFGVLTGSPPPRPISGPQGDPGGAIAHASRPRLDLPDVSHDAGDVLRTALSWHPDDRYGSALEFARAMQHAQHRHGGHVTPFMASGVSPYPSGLPDEHGGRSAAGHGGSVLIAPTQGPPKAAASGDRTRASHEFPGEGRPPDFTHKAIPSQSGPGPVEPGPVEAGPYPAGSPDSPGAMAPARAQVPIRRAGTGLSGSATASTIAGTAPLVTAAVALAAALTAGMPATIISGTAPAIAPETISVGAAQDDPRTGEDAGYVPSVERLNGVYQGNTVTFTWINPEPREGDLYAWAPIDGGTAQPQANAGIVADRSVVLHDVTDTRTCIRVSIVRSDRRMSAKPAAVCADQP